MKVIFRENLIIRKSFKLAFAGGEIWCEELDSLSIHKDIVIEKFLQDMKIIQRPSSPAFIAVNLNETLVENDIAELIVNELSQVTRHLCKVAFAGLDSQGKKLFRKALKNVPHTYEYQFLDDFEKAKEWLI